MNRKFILAALLLGVGSLIAWMLWQTLHRVEKKQQIAATVQQLPNVSLLALDSTSFSLSEAVGNRAAVLFFFHPDCEHCQSEARQVRENAGALSAAKLIWISYENLSRLREFNEEYKLTESFPQLVMAKIEPVAKSMFNKVCQVMIY